MGYIQAQLLFGGGSPKCSHAVTAVARFSLCPDARGSTKQAFCPVAGEPLPCNDVQAYYARTTACHPCLQRVQACPRKVACSHPENTSNGGMLSVSSVTPSWRFPTTSGHPPALAASAYPPALFATTRTPPAQPALPSLTPNMYTSSGHAGPFPQDFTAQSGSDGGSCIGVQGPWPLQGGTTGPPSLPQAPLLQATVQPAKQKCTQPSFADGQLSCADAMLGG